TPADPGDRTCDLRTRALHGYQDLADCLQQNHLRAYRDLELAVDATNDAVERTLRSFEEPSLLLSLATHDDVDRFTVGHSVRVALLALQVAREIGASRDQLVHVGTAALMHDIGKSKVPQEVLFKQGRLSDEEWALMAQHPRLGAQLLLEQGERIDARTIGAAFCHHMGPSGLGYPQPLLPTVPSGTSNLVRVCDVFEALTAVRPYKHALTPIEAYAVMFRSEQDFDSAWLRTFARVLGLFPIGSRVLLRDGSHGMVVAQSSRPDRPVVQLLAGPDGADLPADHPGKVTIGQPFEGRVPVLHSVTLNDRCLPLPELDCKDDMVHRCVHGACLPSAAPAPGGTR
ncbi:MAG: HD domain-containing protein, partial [Planctomycetes bacterium]|nr:HD domain-containing protein [Planctomycetota bacterium]